jgi:Ca2+-binding EF-hand superfamily protein
LLFIEQETEPGDDEKTKVGPDNQQLVPAGQPAPPMYEDYVPEFTEEEIVAAFKFIDLDHNNFVGAKEIRHVLVCMGEMITDEEIDAMISLVDVDGDGQVSFAEFRAMVNHPDPGNADMQKEILMKKDQLVAVDAQHNLGVDLNAYQRQKEMTLRESKKKMLVNFAKENEVTFDYIKIAYQSFVDMPREQKAKGKVKFAQFCDALSVEPIAEYKLLHNLFDLEETGEADFREFLLSLMNFIDIDKEARMRFSFIMFDDKKTGYITKKEVEEILRGNHMISLQSVVRKADTVMRQATSTSTGAIGINELVVISKKFPNIMLPSIGITKS